MTFTRFTHISACLSLFTALLAGCSGDDTSTSATDSSSTTDAGSDSNSSTSNGTTSTTGGETSTSTTAGMTTSTSTTSDTMATTSTTGVTPQPDGSMCSADAECESMSCYNVPLLGGLCGECKVDSDCDGGGCTIPNPLAGIGATCNKGGSGEGCMSDEVCNDPNAPFCGTVLDASPIIKVLTCGECKTNADCMDAKAPNCSPDISVADFNGLLSCVPDNSVPNDTACSLVKDGEGTAGDKACESGKCTTATLEGVVKIGICGTCFTDADCDGKKCMAAAVDTNSGDLKGAFCM